MAMRRGLKFATVVIVAGIAGVAAYGVSILRHGISTRKDPSAVETLLARRLRHLAVPAAERERANPVPLVESDLAEARAHFADHCAICHGNDGKGETHIGQNLYPKAPDMSATPTQSLSDGELYAIIRNGVRLTGMPAWGDETSADDPEIWKLVHLIRHFPKITPEELREMEALNPVSPAENGDHEHSHGETSPPQESPLPGEPEREKIP